MDPNESAPGKWQISKTLLSGYHTPAAGMIEPGRAAQRESSDTQTIDLQHARIRLSIGGSRTSLTREGHV